MAKKAQIDAVRPALEATDKVLNKVEGALDVLDKVADKGADGVESGLEMVADIVPDALDTTVHVTTTGGRKIVQFFRDPKHAAITVVVLSTAAGAALGVAGYFALKKRLESKYQLILDERLNEESEALREFYAKKNKAEGFETPQAAVEKLLTKEAAEALRDYEGGAVISTDQQVIEEVAATEPVVAPTADELAALRDRLRSGTPVKVEEDVRNNIFVDGQPLVDFDYESEVLNRNPEEPYVITHDEYMENEDDRTQNQLTYYNGDDILADDQDMPIADIEEVVGSENLTKFGYGSNNRNVVYVRNEKIDTDFEITLSEGKFGDEVAGLKHSAPPLRRFRNGDDE